MLRIWLKRVICSTVFYRAPLIVVASTGRAGSTMLTTSIIEILCDKVSLTGTRLEKLLLRRMLYTFRSRIEGSDKLLRGVLKTHDLPNFDLTKYKTIYTYGDPFVSALSVDAQIQKHGINWFYRHQKNLHGMGSIDDLLITDVLGYEQQICAWSRFIEHENVFVVNYDDLWARQESLKEFLQLDLQLPSQKPRETRVQIEVPSIFKHLYAVAKRVMK